MAPHIGTKSAQNCPNIDPISDHSNPGQIEGHIWHKIEPICDQELAQFWPLLSRADHGPETDQKCGQYLAQKWCQIYPTLIPNTGIYRAPIWKQNRTLIVTL